MGGGDERAAVGERTGGGVTLTGWQHNVRYGRRHRRLRRSWAGRIALGGVLCARCGLEILPASLWDLGHVDGGGPVAYAGPEHRACNRATAAHKAAASRR